MNAIRLGLFQESTDRFAFALHADTAPARLYQGFSARDLRAAIVEQPEGGRSVRLVSVPTEVEQARDLVFETMSRDQDSVVTGGVMALDTLSDSWQLTVLRDDMPGYHVALAFSFYPLRALFGRDNLVHIACEVAAERASGAVWHMVCPALAAQAAAIVFPDAPTGADACALLAQRPGVMDYLMGMGYTFSLADIEVLARRHQFGSIVSAAALGPHGEDRTWLYRVKLSARAIAHTEKLAVSYARARTRHAAGLRSRPPRDGLREEGLKFRETEIERFAHHLALLELCVEYGIGLSSRPASADGRWSVAVNRE